MPLSSRKEAECPVLKIPFLWVQHDFLTSEVTPAISAFWAARMCQKEFVYHIYYNSYSHSIPTSSRPVLAMFSKFWAHCETGTKMSIFKSLTGPSWIWTTTYNVQGWCFKCLGHQTSPSARIEAQSTESKIYYKNLVFNKENNLPHPKNKKQKQNLCVLIFYLLDNWFTT